MLVESLDIEREEKIYLSCDATVVADDDNDDLPYNVTGVAVDDDVDDIVTYLVVTNNPKGDLTVHSVDEAYDVVLWSSSIGFTV